MGNSGVYIIAEVGQAHDGSLGILHSYIDAAASTGVDAIKFQTHIAEAESSEHEPFRVNFSYEDKTRFDYWKRVSFTEDQWGEIKAHCDEKGLDFISSPFSIAAVELLERVGVSKYKIGSGEITNHLMLNKIASTGKPVILSSGMSSYDELSAAVSIFREAGAELSILQCTTKYPTAPSDIGLNVIRELRSRFNVPAGLSDHSGKIFSLLAAVSLGAEVLEAHIVFDKRMFGPDSSSSLSIEDFSSLVEGVRDIELMINNPIDKNNNAQFKGLKNIFEKSLAVNTDLKAGSVIKIEQLEAKKPAGMGVSASEYVSVIGKQLTRDIKQWEFLSSEDILND